MFKKPAPRGHSRSSVKLRRTGCDHADRLAADSLNATPRLAAKTAKLELSSSTRDHNSREGLLGSWSSDPQALNLRFRAVGDEGAASGEWTEASHSIRVE